MSDVMSERSTGTWLAVTSISFDISVLELFWTLARGFKVVIQEELVKAAAGADDSARRASDQRTMDFSLFYFSADASERCAADASPSARWAWPANACPTVRVAGLSRLMSWSALRRASRQRWRPSRKTVSDFCVNSW